MTFPSNLCHFAQTNSKQQIAVLIYLQVITSGGWIRCSPYTSWAFTAARLGHCDWLTGLSCGDRFHYDPWDYHYLSFCNPAEPVYRITDRLSEDLDKRTASCNNTYWYSLPLIQSRGHLINTQAKVTLQWDIHHTCAHTHMYVFFMWWMIIEKKQKKNTLLHYRTTSQWQVPTFEFKHRQINKDTDKTNTSWHDIIHGLWV